VALPQAVSQHVSDATALLQARKSYWYCMPNSMNTCERVLNGVRMPTACARLARWKPLEATFMAATILCSPFVKLAAKGQLSFDWPQFLVGAVLPNAQRAGTSVTTITSVCFWALLSTTCRFACLYDQPDLPLLATRAACLAAYWMKYMPQGSSCAPLSLRPMQTI